MWLPVCHKSWKCKPVSPADSVASRHVLLKLGRRSGPFFGPTKTSLVRLAWILSWKREAARWQAASRAYRPVLADRLEEMADDVGADLAPQG